MRRGLGSYCDALGAIHYLNSRHGSPIGRAPHAGYYQRATQGNDPAVVNSLPKLQRNYKHTPTPPFPATVHSKRAASAAQRMAGSFPAAKSKGQSLSMPYPPLLHAQQRGN